MSARAYAHFIGVGGAGMSGLARILHDRGITVTGSDLKDSRYASALRESGVTVFIGHAEENIGDPDVVVVSSAIPESNPELKAARARGLDVWPRARMLAHLAGDLETIGVAGTHGKTTTSAMLATMLDGVGEDPTFVVGGEVTERKTNAACGTGRHYVVEADESDGSFVFLDPKIALITNIEAEHLDHYGSLDAVERTFVEFMHKVPEDGALIVCADDERLVELAQTTGRRVVTYGSAPTADVRYRDVVRDGKGQRFDVIVSDLAPVSAAIGTPGEHMVQNATGALACAWFLGLDVGAAAAALESYGGVKRRFDMIGRSADVDVVDDYAHHPTEIRATLAAAAGSGYRRVWVVFQPHRYTRTQALAGDFGSAFEDADGVVLMDIYSAGETPIPGVTGKTLVDSVLAHDPKARVAFLPHRSDLVPFMAQNARSGDLVMTMGAGDVTTLGPELLRAFDGDESNGKDRSCR